MSVRNRRTSILCFLHRDSKVKSTDCIASYNYRCLILLTSGGYDAHFQGTAGEVRSLVLSNNLQKIWRWHNIIQIHNFILQQVHLQAKCKVPFHLNWSLGVINKFFNFNNLTYLPPTFLASGMFLEKNHSSKWIHSQIHMYSSATV